MVNEKFIVIGLYSAYIVTLIFMLLPESNAEVLGYPFGYDGKLTVRTYVYFACERIGLMILFYSIARAITKYYQHFVILFWLELLGLADYFLSYNSTWFHVGQLSIEFAFIKVLVFSGVVIHITFFKK
ncbi:MAG TPA: hypothetical protein VFD46_07060 [Chryseolinea sp.]|nr:hypothetical protein [Chryseolinea sp.]